MTSLKGVRPEATVKARLHQLESAVATSEHLSKHPEQLRKRRDKGKHVSDSDSEDDDGSEDFADLLRMLTLDARFGNSSQHDALHEAFKILDCDEDGYITLADLRQAMNDDDDEEEEKLSDDDLLDMIAAADERGNGRISFDNFVKILEPKKGHDGKNADENNLHIKR